MKLNFLVIKKGFVAFKPVRINNQSNMKKALIITLSLSVITGFAQSQTKSFSLKEAQDYAQQNSYAVKDKNLAFEKAKKQILETAAIGLPQVSFNADYTYNSQLAATPLPDGFASGEDSLGNPNLDGNPDLVVFGVEHQTTASVSVNQLLFDASYFVALKATTVVKDIANLNIEKAKIDIAKEVAKSYFLVAVAEENERVMGENAQIIRKNLFEVREYYKNGLLEEQDVDQLEIILLNVESSLRNAKRAKTFSLKLLQFQMGLPINDPIELKDNLDVLLNGNNTESELLGTKFQLLDHIDYRLMETQRVAAELQIDNQKNTFYPKISAFLRHTESNFGNDQFNAFQFDRTWVPGTAMGLSLRWNVFQGSGRIARIQQAKIDLRRVDIAMQTTSSSLQLDYEKNKSDFEFALDNYLTQIRSLELTKKVRDKIRIKYKEGISSSLDLSQAETQYSQAQGAYFQAALNFLNAKQELSKSLGK